MAQAIAKGLSNQNNGIVAYDITKISNEAGVQIASSVAELEQRSDLILLCVKPKDMTAAVSMLQGSKPCISIAAGLSVTTIQSYFQNLKPAVARVMPNLGAVVGHSASAVFCQDNNLHQKTIAIFKSIGSCISVNDEALMHGITGLSGSGPAYVFLMIQSLAEAGVREGLSFDDSMLLSVETVLAAAHILKSTNEHPAELIRKVASPAGTTIEGLAALEANQFKHAIYEAVKQASDRSRKLSETVLPPS